LRLRARAETEQLPLRQTDHWRKVQSITTETAAILRIRIAALCALLFASHGALGCTLTQWSSVSGSVQTGTPRDTLPIKRYSGPCGIRADGVGDWVADTRPANEANYTVRFYFYPESLLPVVGQTLGVFEARLTSDVSAIRVTYDGAALQFHVAGAPPSALIAAPSGKWYSIAFQWRAAGPGSFSYQVGAAQPGTLTWQAAITSATYSLDGSVAGYRIDDTRMGLVTGALASGAVYFDDFTSASTTTLQRACRCDANNDFVIGIQDRILITNEILGVSLASGQPDCTDDGIVSIQDRIVVTNEILPG
jgi:hypothetical protein